MIEGISKTILHNIIDYYYPDKKERASLFGRINGIIGNLNTSQCSYSKQEFYNILKQKFLSRSDLEWITNTEEFDQFLFRKTEENISKEKLIFVLNLHSNHTTRARKPA